MNFKLVESTQNSVIKKIVAFLLIVVLTMFDFILLGTEMVSYAADAVETATSNKNVTFDTYFKDKNGLIITEKDEKINSKDIKLFVRVSVKNDGYFNGTISLEESNFNLKNEILHTSINKIENNTITLNQINSGEVAEFEIGIEPIKEDTINSRFLNMSSKLSINGIYRNIKEKDIKINATREVKLKLTSPYTEAENADVNLAILTNKVYELEGTNKRIVQVLVESGLKGNEYPIKENNIEVSVPDGVESVEVNSRGMLVTNGNNETDFTSNNWKYSEKDNKISVSIKNDKEPIKWIKSGKDIIVVTFIMNPEKDVSETEITAKSIISLYNEERTIEGMALAKIKEEKDGIITTGIKLSEQQIYKGKLYSGENRDYSLAEEIYINSNKVSKEINVEFKASTFGTQNGEIPANIQYKNTRINKADIMRILGTEGILKISTLDGTAIAEVNSQSETDENGYITINYPDGITALKVTSTKTIDYGTISFENTKTIKQNGNSREIIKTYNSIIERMTDTEKTIELKETETSAELKINKIALSTLAKNENVEIAVTLNTNNEKYDLFKNPSFEIILPELINDINVKSIQPVYSEMFKVVNTQVVEGNNKSRIIRFALEGEQTSYTSEVNQTTIIITADIQFDILAPSTHSTINMNYTNQNGVQGNYTANQPIEVESKYGLMMYTTMSGYNEENDKITTMDDEVVKGSLDIEGSSKIATVKETLVNNYDETMENVSVIGRIPTEGMNDGTVNTKLTGAVKTSIPNAQVLYSADANAKAEDGTWQTNSEGAKSFKIDATNLEKGATVEAEYSFEVPEKVDYGQTMITRLDANYSYLGNAMAQTSTLGAETIKLTGVSSTELKNSVSTENNGLKVDIGATTAGRELKDGEAVYEGQAIEYTVHVTNNTGKDLNNAKISVEQENGTMYGLKEVEVYSGPVKAEGEKTEIQHAYRELDTNKKDFNNIETIKNGATVLFVYEIKTNQVEQSAQTKGKITIKADNFDETHINTISNNIEQAELKLSYSYRLKEEVQLYSGQKAQTLLKVENISNADMKNVKVTVRLPENTYASEQYIYEDGKESITNLNYNEEKNIITFEIPELKKDENKSLVVYANTTELKTTENNLVFIAEAVTESEKTYYSNVVTRNIKANPVKVEITQDTNLGDEQSIKYGDEFNIIITAKNNSEVNTIAKISDELPNCFKVLSARMELPNETKQLEILDIENEEIANNELSSYIINNKDLSEMKLVVSEALNANQQIKVILNVILDKYTSEKSVTNTASMVCGEVDGEYFVNSQTAQSRKTFDIEDMDSDYYVEVNQTANIENKSTINNGTEILYSTKIRNISNNPIDVVIKDTLPSGIEPKEILLGGVNVSENYSDEAFKSNSYRLEKNSETELKITTVFNESNVTNEELTNIVSVETPKDIVRSNAITYYTASSENNEEKDSSDRDEGKSDNKENSSSNIKYNISGLAWLDANKNGKKDNDETLMEGIEAKIIDTETGSFVQENGRDLSVKTKSDGTYSFNVQRGNYIVVFMYDTNKYTVTQYQRPGISLEKNSDVINKVLRLNDNNIEVAATDTIKLISSDVNNIDMGLLENTKFDFEFNKYISEITVRTSKGVNTYEYDNEDLAKIEIHAKELNNANVIIKYTMRVTNNGEIAGYVKDIVDYIPTALTFNSELNNDWYQSNNSLHNTSLLNTKINAGETKDITLILTKNMTENNTGLICNLAELADVNNELGVEDMDSTPGNKAQGEDDLGKADVIISVKTGALVTYVSLVLIILITIGISAIAINKKVLKNNIDIDINL